jgi:hypothetical protein
MGSPFLKKKNQTHKSLAAAHQSPPLEIHKAKRMVHSFTSIFAFHHQEPNNHQFS